MVAVAVGGVAVLGEAGCGEWCPSPCPHADPLPHPLLWLPPTPSRVPFPASYPALLLSVWMWEGSPLPFPRPCLFLHLYVCVPNLAPFCFLLLAPHTDHCTLLFAHCVCPRLCLEAMAGGGPGPMCCRAALFFPWAVCGSAPCCTVLYTSAWPPPHCLLTSFPFFFVHAAPSVVASMSLGALLCGCCVPTPTPSLLSPVPLIMSSLLLWPWAVVGPRGLCGSGAT